MVRSRFNLSAWALEHQPLLRYLMVVLLIGGAFAFTALGQDEDPPFTFRAMVVRTIRPDTVFIPYHWSGPKSANKLTHRTLDPRSKIPEFKVSACRIRKADAPPEWATR